MSAIRVRTALSDPGQFGPLLWTRVAAENGHEGRAEHTTDQEIENHGRDIGGDGEGAELTGGPKVVGGDCITRQADHPAGDVADAEDAGRADEADFGAGATRNRSGFRRQFSGCIVGENSDKVAWLLLRDHCFAHSGAHYKRNAADNANPNVPYVTRRVWIRGGNAEQGMRSAARREAARRRRSPPPQPS